MTKAPRRGRPPRTDKPVAIRVNLPGELRQWLRVQAAIEARDQGDVIADALKVYRRSSHRATREAARLLIEDAAKGGKS